MSGSTVLAENTTLGAASKVGSEATESKWTDMMAELLPAKPTATVEDMQQQLMKPPASGTGSAASGAGDIAGL